MNKIDDLFRKVDDEIRELRNLLFERIGVLSKISAEKGINDFGWKNGMPDEDEYDDEDEYESDWESFNESQFSFILTDDFAYQTGEVLITRFKFDGGELVGTEYYDDDEVVLCTDACVRFSIIDERNLKSVYYLIKMIEEELGVED